MSLLRQLWLAVIASTLIAFSGSLLVSLLTARHYLEQQLAIKNADNAASLALSMSQLPKDPVTIELQVAALFDSGQYAQIRVLDPEGRPIIERLQASGENPAPEWFSRLLPISSREGLAQVSNGWQQFASVHLVSHADFAYAELWRGAVQLVIWFMLGGLLVGLIGMEMVRRIRRPLAAVVGQAQAISERRFTRIEEPQTPELRSLARAMNDTVSRLKSMFEEEAARLEQMRREATQDPLSGLANRAFFMNQLTAALADEDAAAHGSVLILRLSDLAGINKRSGREAADEVIRRIGRQCALLIAEHRPAAAGRLNGADFALLLGNVDDPRMAAERLLDTLRDLASAGFLDPQQMGHVASSAYHHGEALGQLLARLDAALASGESQGALSWQQAPSSTPALANNAEQWRSLLLGAIQSQRLRLIDFPVAGQGGQLLHLECPLRLQAQDQGEWLAAGSFMPMASRLSMTTELDLAAVRLALERIAEGAPAVAVNLAGESLLDADFLNRLHDILHAQRALVGNLWLEVSELGAFQHFAAFRQFCDRIRPLGCQLGIEHFGRQLGELGRLHDTGIHYLKVDASFIRDVHHQAGNQTLLKGVCGIAHNMGLSVIAEGVRAEEEWQALLEIGFDGATGPAITAR